MEKLLFLRIKTSRLLIISIIVLQFRKLDKSFKTAFNLLKLYPKREVESVLKFYKMRVAMSLRNENTLKYNLLFLVAISALASCNTHSGVPIDTMRIIEKAGNNKSELLEVIEYYSKHEKDSLKLKATYFLINNFDGLMTLDSNSVKANNVYHNTFSSMWGINKKRLSKGVVSFVVDSINKSQNLSPQMLRPSYVKELETVSSNFLVDNIDEAFYVWKNMPWAKNIAFDAFCEYILFYRCTDTYSLNSRRFFLIRYKDILDSVKHTDDKGTVGDFIKKDIDGWFLNAPTLSLKYPYLHPMSFSQLMQGKFGDCQDINSVYITAMRSLGLPVALDQIPNWGNQKNSHYWYKIIRQENDTVKTRMSNENLPLNTNAIVDASKFDLIPVIPGVPKNITIHYEVKLDNYAENQKFAYLCIFDNQYWKPVTWAKVSRGEAVFKNMGKNIVYLPAYYSQYTSLERLLDFHLI